MVLVVLLVVVVVVVVVVGGSRSYVMQTLRLSFHTGRVECVTCHFPRSCGTVGRIGWVWAWGVGGGIVFSGYLEVGVLVVEEKSGARRWIGGSVIGFCCISLMLAVL